MTRRSARAALAAAVLALAVAPAAASASAAFPMQLPGDASTARVQASSSTWIVGARPGATAAALARRYGATVTGPAGTGGYVLARGRARAFAGALERAGVLVYAQPDVLRRQASMPEDPFDSTYTWRNHIVDPSLTPPLVTPTSPLIALVDAAADVNHPELIGHTTTLPHGPPVVNPHGTGTASVASASANGAGFSGVWPGARTLNVPLDENITCSESANGIASAIKASASVINMSYGSSVPCVPETTALQYAVGRGIVPVAAAGNEFQEGNPLEFPASLPHVMTVGAITESEKPAYFSNANVALDVVAPGVGIPIAVPPSLDADGDGYAVADGTSFSAPMVSAAIAWLRAARPSLWADQAANLLRFTARDLGRKGYDATTGYGVIDLAKALKGKAGLHDPGEPNDDIPWVDGTMFSKPDPPVYKGTGKPTRLVASVDQVEDPADVYRVKVLGHRKVHVIATPLFGHITLLAYAPDAKQLSQKSRRIARSARPGKHIERVTLVNTSRKARTFFVAVNVPSGRLLNATYRLTVKR